MGHHSAINKDITYTRDHLSCAYLHLKPRKITLQVLMEAAMVSAFSGAMGSLLAKLAALLEKDFKLASGAKKDIVLLRDEMRSINTSLTVLSEMEEPIDLPHRELRDKVRELAYDMEDCVDIYMHRVGGDANKAGFLRDLKTLGARYEAAKLIIDLKARVAELGSRRKLMVQLPECRPRAAVRVDPRIQALYTDAANLQGIGGPRQELVELLQDGAPQLKVVSVLGFGGIGKTTLANQVYNAIQGRYDCTAFVSVSRIPDLAKILSDILDRVGWYSSSQDDVDKLIRRLRKYLQDKRYLIVIDDIWTIQAWNIIKCCLIDNNRGSRVITTTRTEDTAKECCSTLHGYVYRIRPLNDVDSRRLFYRRIFHSEDACPEQLKCISNEILKKCGGLPLAILTIGSILASHQETCSMEIWEKVMHSFRFQLETSPALEWMRHVFDLGYNDLSLGLKTCMLYLGIFPEDCKILKDDLLRRWIAEGFITERHGDSQEEEEIAERYINELINRNVIQIAEFDDCGEVFSVRVHDLLLEYIILKSTEENFITTINDKHSTKGSFEVRRLSLHVRNSENYGVLESMALTQARSFNLWGPAQWLPSLKKFRLLRVLHLDIFGSVDRQYDMSSVSSLFQLRYLRTRGILCKELLQTQLRNLQQLRTLEVAVSQEYFSLDPRMLPSTLWHLDLKGGANLDGGIGRLRDLRTLCEFEIVLKDVRRMKELGELTNLRELKLYRCQSSRDETTCDVLLSSLCRLCSLRSLTIRGPMSLNLDPDFLARWSPPPRHLRRLHVLACLFSTVPADFLDQLGNLSSLEIKVRSLPSDGAGVLARLTLLVHLTLHAESAPREGVVVFGRETFPNLREFSFRCEAPCLAFEAGAMPRLRVLHIECYMRGTRLTDTDGVLDGIEHLGSLDELKVDVFERENFISRYLCCADVEKPHVEEHRKWEGESLEAALKEAISKHPGSSLRAVIRTV